MNPTLYFTLLVVTVFGFALDVEAFATTTSLELSRRDRRLNGSEVSSLVDCSGTMMYELRLEVSGTSLAHLSFIAKPLCDTSDDKSCESPILFLDSSFNLEGDHMDQAIYAGKKEDNLVVDEQESLMIGLFPLKAILDSVAAVSNQDDGTKYDFITNNCASFIISMMQSLGIDPADKKITSFVTQQISNEFVMAELLKTDVGNIYTNDYDGDNDAVVVENFISNYIQQRI